MSTSCSVIAFVLTIAVLATAQSAISSEGAPSTYIIHVKNSLRPSVFSTAHDWYSSTLASVRGTQLQDVNDDAEQGPLYSYGTVFHGFAARLTPDQAQVLQEMDAVLSIVDDRVFHLHTTHSPEFMGLNGKEGLWPASSYGGDVIIGVLDSGIWPESQSFADATIGPVPARWKGICEVGSEFTTSMCNKKLIGARAFYKGYEAAMGAINETVEYKSARDSEGHGTHTASTAAGNAVNDASLEGAAFGTARGMASDARIAVYKVCWKDGCLSSDILAAFEQAVSDGVDIISLSVGGGVVPYFIDPIAIGSFGAMEKGILVSASAGNSGPSSLSVANLSPWLLTVGASTIDRDFPATVNLPDGTSFKGISLSNGNPLGSELPLIYAGDGGFPGGNSSVNLCFSGLLDPARVKGKVVLCDRGVNARTAKGIAVKEAGGAGMILANALENGEELIADCQVLPAVLVGYTAGDAIKKYITQAKAPMVSIIFSGTVVGVRPAPVMAAFSSRGPNSINPEILKPDITAPGVNILAAWTSKLGPTGQPGDDRVVDFNILSGTSMSCPHVSGLAALLKGAHPEWSPAAIKSALMTTAFDMDNMGKIMSDDADSSRSTPFAFGAGHVNPNGALDPGLVYDLRVQDYVDFLCSVNLSGEALAIFSKGDYNCSSNGDLDPSNLNYPSMSFVFYQTANASAFKSTVTRTVTNVGSANSIYAVSINTPPGVLMTVEPTTLSFTTMYEKKSYIITCEAEVNKGLSNGDSNSVFGSIVWSDKAHTVRSPIAFTWQKSLF